tara:strand:- start:178 stop:639 length:462 start_codon:yes stop_codon:yes gene_type:complete
LIKYILILFVSFSFAQIPEDKKLHFAAGNMIGAGGYAWSYHQHYDKKRATINGVCWAFAGGVMKEIYDGTSGNGYVELNDVWATTIGGLVSVYVINLFNKKKRLNYRQLDKKLGGYYYEKNYKEISYNNYTAFYELDIYTSYNTREVSKAKKK